MKDTTKLYLLTIGLLLVLFALLWKFDASFKQEVETKFNSEITEQEWGLIAAPTDLGKDVIRHFGLETYVRMILMGWRFDGEPLSPAEAQKIFDKINDGYDYDVVWDGVE